MNITKDLHDKMVEIGFRFEPLKINQAEPIFLIARLMDSNIEYEFTIRIPNGPQTQISLVVMLLNQEVYHRGITRGNAQGKREIGNYLKELIN